MNRGEGPITSSREPKNRLNAQDLDGVEDRSGAAVLRLPLLAGVGNKLPPSRLPPPPQERRAERHADADAVHQQRRWSDESVTVAAGHWAGGAEVAAHRKRLCSLHSGAPRADRSSLAATGHLAER